MPVLGVGVLENLVLGWCREIHFGAWLNFPNSGLLWQKEPVLILPDLDYLQKRCD